MCVGGEANISKMTLNTSEFRLTGAFKAAAVVRKWEKTVFFIFNSKLESIFTCLSALTAPNEGSV